MPFKWQNENENMPFKQQKAKRAFTRTFASQDYGVFRTDLNTPEAATGGVL